MIFQQPPPFEPTEFEAIAITNMGFMFAEILILVIFMVLMIYLYKKVKEGYLPIIVVFLFSLIVGVEAMTHIHTHFSPYLEVFFLLFQASFFVMYVLENIQEKKRKAGR